MQNQLLAEQISKACARIAPYWTLEASVAVNPFLGFSDKTFESAAADLRYRNDIKLHMTIDYYLNQLKKGLITESSLRNALDKSGLFISIDKFLQKCHYLKDKEYHPEIFKTAVNSDYNGSNYESFMVDHISGWMASKFDENIQSDQMSDDMLFSSWLHEAKIDVLPEIEGLKEFRKSLQKLPTNQDDAIQTILDQFYLKEEDQETFLHSLLLKVLGWSSYCAGLDWNNKLYDKPTNYLKAFLTILLAWEYAYFNHLDAEKQNELVRLYINKNNQVHTDDYFIAQCVLQDAFDFSEEHRLVQLFDEKNGSFNHSDISRPQAQLIFCIDVRSEIYRRNLEEVNNDIETIGFAGFFGFPIQYKPITNSTSKNQCPVLIKAQYTVNESLPNSKYSVRKYQSIGKRTLAWKGFKSGSFSSYSFVSPLGLSYLPKLISKTFRLNDESKISDRLEFGNILNGKHELDLSGIAFEEQLTMAKNALIGMGLIDNFARLVMFTGHGSQCENNPFASGLNCGACGGNSGEINALVAQQILNDPKIREYLKESKISIPNDTFFAAAVHNTTTDEITTFEHHIPESHLEDLAQLKNALSIASRKSRIDRSKRLGVMEVNADIEIFNRSKDWSQVRPEWGLAGCNAFVIAPRSRTAQVNLKGKAFLHSYNWKNDAEFNVLEAIMTAPMVVTSWINLQYYASTVDQQKLGAGNKTIHNVIGGVGVFEGSKGDLKIGLPFQSVHDGKEYQHDPHRLKVIIEAPKDAINEIINKHSEIKELVENKWITILRMNKLGKITERYESDLNWSKVDEMEFSKTSAV